MSRFAELAMQYQKSATHTKAHDFEYKNDHFDVSSEKLLVYKQMKFILKMIIGCHPE